MIEVTKNYKLTLTEQQALELYRLLQDRKSDGHVTHDSELILLYHELHKLFGAGVR